MINYQNTQFAQEKILFQNETYTVTIHIPISLP